MFRGVNSDTPQNVNVGLAGSLTMIVLCAGVALLCTSFYRRYKRAQVSDFDLGDQSERDAKHPIPQPANESSATNNENE